MIKINPFRTISYRDTHEILSDRLNEIVYGLTTPDKYPTLTLTSKVIDNTTYYRWKIDFTNADKIFGKCEYPIELLMMALVYHFSLQVDELFIATQVYWDYDRVNTFVKSISFTLFGHDDNYIKYNDYVDYVDYSGFEPVLLYAHK